MSHPSLSSVLAHQVNDVEYVHCRQLRTQFENKAHG